MRRYDIVSGVILTLSIIDFALAAPVLVQEKRQARVDVVNIPKDVTTILGKRGDEELEKLVEELFGTGEKPVESSNAHASSSSAQPGPGHGSMNDVQEQASNTGPSKDPDFDWDYWTNLESPPRPRPALPKAFGQAHEDQVGHVPLQDLPSNDPADFDWNHWMDVVNPPPLKRPKLASSKEFGQAHGYQPNPRPLPDSDLDLIDDYIGLDDLLAPMKEPEASSSKAIDQAHEDQMVHVQPEQPNLGSPKGPDDDGDIQAAIYASKGKAKESRRHIPGTARVVGNAAQTRGESQPV